MAWLLVEIGRVYEGDNKVWVSQGKMQNSKGEKMKREICKMQESLQN